MSDMDGAVENEVRAEALTDFIESWYDRWVDLDHPWAAHDLAEAIEEWQASRKVEVTDEMVERAAKRIWEVRFVVNDNEWWESIADKGPYKREARTVLDAALGGGTNG